MKRATWTRYLRTLFPVEAKRSARRAARRVILERLEDRLAPATFIWTGQGTDNKWTTGGNWLGGVAPTGAAASLDDLSFPAGASQTVTDNNIAVVNGVPATFRSITISGSGYEIGGFPLALGDPSAPGSGSLVVSAGVQGASISVDVKLGAAAGAKQFFVVNSAADVTITGKLSSTASVELTKQGTGTLVLGGDNSAFGGQITVESNAGVLQITDSRALGSTAAGTVIGLNSQLQLKSVGGGGDILESLILNGTGISGDGALLNVAGINTWAGTIRLDTDVTFGAAAGSAVITGQVTDLGAGHSVTKEGPGEVVFAAANTYRGLTTIHDGVLTIRDALSLGAGDGGAATGTIVNRTIAKAGQLRLEGPAGGGFTVLDERLTLNGAGPGNAGALLNSQGDNQWASSVLLRSPGPNDSIAANIGAAGGSSLLISGVVSTPNGGYDLVKVGAGRLILNNVNTYTGSGVAGTFPTNVQAGALNIRDSRALSTGSVNVASGASLELEIDSGLDPHGRNLAADSVTGVFNKLQVANTLTIAGNGLGNAGALRSISGINTYTGGVTLSGTAAIGVEPDPNASNSNLYFTNDWSLTVTGNVGGGNLVKRGTGQLILPNANTYTGTTAIQQGWITAQNDRSLGALAGGSDTVQPQATVSAGASLMLKPRTPGASFNFLKRLVLSGTGITHPFALISGKGALMSLGGNNTVGGTEFSRKSDIQLNGVAGIGVELLGPDTTSTLTITGTITDAGATPGGITKLGSRLLVLQGDGTYTGANTVQEGVLRVQNDTALGLSSTGTANATASNAYTTTTTTVSRGITELQSLTIGGTPGTYTLTFNGQTTGPIPSDATALDVRNALAALTSIAGTGGTVSVTKSGNVYMVTFGGAFTGFNQPQLVATPAGGTLVAVATLMDGDGAALEIGSTVPWLNGGVSRGLGVWHENLTLNSPGNSLFGDGPLTVLTNDNLWRGPVTLTDHAVVQVPPSARLTVLGGVGDATNPSPSGSNITLVGGGKLSLGGSGTFRGTTFVTAGVLTLENGLALGATGAAEVQTVTRSGSASGTFTLTFNGQTTPALPFGATDVQVRDALNALPTIGGVGGLVTVSLAGDVYTVTFQGSFVGFNQPALVAAGSGGTAVTVGTLRQGAGGTVVADGASVELKGSLTVVGEPLIVQGRGGPDASTVQQISLSGLTSGTYTLSFKGQTTAPLAFNSSPAAIQTALNGLSTIGAAGGSVSVTGSGTPAIQEVTVAAPNGTYTLTFNGQTTAPLAQTATEAQVEAALNALSTIGGVGGSVTVTQFGTTEVQRVNVAGTAGTFTLSFKGQTTAALPFNETAANVQAALEGLSTIGAGNVFVDPVPGGYLVTFDGALIIGDQPMLVGAGAGGATVTVTEVVQGNVINTVTFGGTLGAGDVPPLSGAAAGGSVTVVQVQQGQADPFYTVTFGGGFTGTPQPLLVAAGLGGTTVSISTPTGVPAGWFSEGPSSVNGYAGAGTQAVSGRITGVVADPTDTNVIYVSTAGGGVWKTKDGGRTWLPMFDLRIGAAEVQTVTVNGAAGTFTLTFNGATTAVLPVNATARQVERALNDLPTIGGASGSVSVTQAGNVYTVTFGGELNATNVPQMTLTGSGGASGSVTSVNGIAANAAGYIGTIMMDSARNVYIGTGEANNTADSFYGTGLYTSTDAGAHWSLVSGTQHQHVTVKGPEEPNTGTFTLEFNGEVTGDIASDASAAAVKAALDALTTIGPASSVNVTRTGIAEVQRLTVTATTGTYTLTFNGQTTAALAFNATAAQIQAALEALSTIGTGNVSVAAVANSNPPQFTITFTGAKNDLDQSLITPSPGAGNVVEVTQGGALFDITWNGPLSQTEAPMLFGLGSGGTDVTVTIPNPYNPFDGQAVSKVVVDRVPATPVIYVASGDPNPGNNEVQEIDFFAAPITFTLSFTATDGTGSVVTLTTPSLSYGGPTSINATALAVSNALNALANVNGSVTVTVTSGTSLEIEFVGQHARTNVQQLVSSTTNAVVSTLTEGFAGRVINGTSSALAAPGIWRLRNGVWFNMTAVVSTNRATVPTTQAVPINAQGQIVPDVSPIASDTGALNATIPNTPGPDDDYRMEFPQFAATWTDLALIYTDNSNVAPSIPVDPVLYAALGTASGDVNNGVFWTQGPMSNTPIWYIGDPGGSPFSSPAQPPPPGPPPAVDSRSGGFERGLFFIPFGNSARPDLPLHGTITIAAVAGAFFNTGTVWAVSTNANGQLRNVYRTTNGGQAYTALASPGFTADKGESSNAIVLTNANTAYVGWYEDNATTHLRNLVQTTDGGGTWTDLSLINGVGPHTGIQALSRDASGRLLVATEGGLWRQETNGSWSDLNGNLTVSQVNGVASHPSDPNIAYAGVQHNGVAKFGGGLAWTAMDATGLGGGQIRVDPKNPNNIYYVQLVQNSQAVIRRSTNGGLTWTSSVLNTGQRSVPLALDTVNTARLVVGASYRNGLAGRSVVESVDRGVTWTQLQAPLETASELAIATFQGTFVPDPDFTEVRDKGTSTYDPDTIYVTDGFNLFLTKDHGTSWVDRTGFWSGDIADLEVDPRNRDHIYAVSSAFGFGFGGEHVFASTDAGQTWTDISNNLPDVPVWKIVVDPRSGDLYVGTDDGVYWLRNGSPNGGWQRMGVGLGNVQVRDLDLNQTTNTLRAGTYGRGVFTLHLDDNRVNVGALRAVSGSSVWSGPVQLVGGAVGNSVIISANGTQALQDGIATASLDLAGAVSDLVPGSAPRLVKLGQGDVILSGPNTYGGVTEVREGALVVRNALALGSSAANTLVNAGTVLEVASDLALEPITLLGDGIPFAGHFGGALRNVANNNTYTGTLTLGTNTTIGVDSGSSLLIGAKAGLPGTGSISDGGGNFSLTKELTGTLILGGASTYGGLTQVNAGILQVRHAQALGGTAGGTAVADGAQLQLHSPDGAPVVVAGEALTLSGTGIFGTGALLNTAGNNAWNGPITLHAAPGFAPQTTPPPTVSFGVARAADTLTLGGAVGEAVASGLTKVGPGRLVLAQANTYRGTTLVTAGIVRVQNSASLGSSSLNEVQRVTVTARTGTVATFTLTFNGQTTVPLDFNVPASGGVGAAASVENALNALPAIGTVVVTKTTVVYGLPGSTFTTDQYTVTFTAPAGSNVAQLVVNPNPALTAAVLTVAEGGGGSGTVVSPGAALEIDGDPLGTGASVNVVGEALTLNGSGTPAEGALHVLSGPANVWTGAVTLQSDTLINTEAGTQLLISGAVQDPTPLPVPSADLTKIGTGTLALSAANPYGGSTFVMEGVLNIRNNGALGTTGPEVQRITLDITGTVGTFTLTFNGQTTAPLAYNVPASGGTGPTASVQNALNALGTIGGVGGSVTVTQSGNVYTVTFGGSLSLGNQSQITGEGFSGVTVFTDTTRDGPEGTFVASGATLQLQGGITVSNELLTVTGAGLGGMGVIDNVSGNNAWVRPITMLDDVVIGSNTAGDALTLLNALVESHLLTNVTKVGPGALTYAGGAGTDMAYTGLTLVREGVLSLSKTGGAVAINGNLTVGDAAGGSVGSPGTELEFAL